MQEMSITFLVPFELAVEKRGLRGFERDGGALKTTSLWREGRARRMARISDEPSGAAAHLTVWRVQLCRN